MNRTQRAVKKACHKAYAHAKREKHLALYERNEAAFFYFEKKAEKFKETVKNEKAIKAWHRKIVNDYAATNPLKEEKTA